MSKVKKHDHNEKIDSSFRLDDEEKLQEKNEIEIEEILPLEDEGSLSNQENNKKNDYEDDDDDESRPNSNYNDIKIIDDDKKSCHSSSDICRICHMGGFILSSYGNDLQIEDEPENCSSTPSLFSYLGPLVSACKCRGTIGLVHTVCLERWLTESGHTRCELCGYRYTTKRVPRYTMTRSVMMWFKTVIATRQMMLDVLYFAVTTPLALFSCYVCVMACKLLMENGIYEIPVMIIAMLPTCSLTMVAYWGWLVTLGRIHADRWRRFWRNNFVIRLIPNPVNVNEIRQEYYENPRFFIENLDFNNWRFEDDESERILQLF